MRYLYFDKLQSRMAYTRYIAFRSGGQVKGNCIHYDNRGSHTKGINLVMDYKLYGFSNHHQTNEMPRMTLFDLNWSRTGFIELFDQLTKFDCLVIRFTETESNMEDFIQSEQDELLRQIIGTLKAPLHEKTNLIE